MAAKDGGSLPSLAVSADQIVGASPSIPFNCLPIVHR